ISRRIGTSRPPTLQARMLEAIGMAVLLGFLPQLAQSRSGMALSPHPGWIAVLVLAARYGSSGWFAGLVAVGAAIVVGAAVASSGFSPLWNALHSGPNLVAFAGSLVVSWIASWHLRRQAILGRRLQVLRRRNRESRAAVDALRGVVTTLR